MRVEARLRRLEWAAGIVPKGARPVRTVLMTCRRGEPRPPVPPGCVGVFIEEVVVVGRDPATGELLTADPDTGELGGVTETALPRGHAWD